MAMQRNTAFIGSQNGSIYAAVAEITCLDTGAVSTPQPMPLFSNSVRDDSIAEDNITLESGAVLTFDGAETSTLKFTILQKDKDTNLFFDQESRGKNYTIVKQSFDNPINGFYEFVIYPKGKFSRNTSFSQPGFEREVTFNREPTFREITLDLTQFNTAGGFTPALTCAAMKIPSGVTKILYHQAI